MTIPRCLFLLKTAGNSTDHHEESETAQQVRSHSAQSIYTMEVREPTKGTLGNSSAAATSLFPRKTCLQNRHLGRSSGFRIALITAPSHDISRSGLLQRSSPVTAAGPQRTCTVFPILSPKQQASENTQVAGHLTLESQGVNPQPARSFAAC